MPAEENGHDGPKPRPEDNDGLIDGKECVHCGLWFLMDHAKRVPGENVVRCPYCDWKIEDPVDPLGM